MGELATYPKCLSLAGLVWAVGASVVGAVRRRDDVVRSAEGAVYATALAVTVAMAALLTAMVTNDFSLQYVADYTSRDLAVAYRIGAMWAGQGGSLLLWCWIAAMCAAWITWQNRRKGWGISPFAVTTFSVVTGAFAAFTAFLESPFKAATVAIADGGGLNPLLQDPLQIVHPLFLYGGYVVYTVPFALVIAALAAKPEPGPWVKVATRWSMFSWIALTAGIVLGARWAYAELGWGGYWAWDPVENASLLPWLTGTALLHTGLTYWKNGRIRLLGVIMVLTTFVLCLFGTFLTRSGVISSVHAFGESSLGPVMGAFILGVIVVSGALVVWRLPQLRLPRGVDAKGHGWVGQLLLAVLLVAMTAAVLWGTIFPLFARALRGEEIAVTPEFFRVVVTPLGVLVLAVFAVSPLLPSQASEHRAREIAVRASVFVGVVLAIWALTGGANPGVALVIALAVLATMSVFRKASMRLRATWKDTHDGTGRVMPMLRASGPYVGHLGLVVLLAAVTLNTAFQSEDRVTLKFGESATVAGQTVRLVDVTNAQLPDRVSWAANVELLGADGQPTGTLVTRQEVFAQQDQPHAEVGIKGGVFTDLYIVLESADLETRTATLTVFVNPAVVWIWVGGMLLIVGGVLFALPRRRGAPALPLEHAEEHAPTKVEV